MKKPINICATGLGHPEGPYELDDGRVIYANTYASEIGVWDPKTGKQGTYAFVGGGPNACMLGTRRRGLFDADARMSAPGSRRCTARRRSRRPRPNGKVEILVTEADGKKFDGPERPDLRAGRPALFHRFRRLGPGDKPHPGRIIVIEKNGTAQDPGGTRPRLSERHRRRARRLDRLGRILHAARSSAARRTARRRSSTPCRRATSPTASRSTSTAISGSRPSPRGGVDVISQGRQAPCDFLEIGGTILNCCFGKGGKLFCCDMGPFDTTGAAMTGRLVEGRCRRRRHAAVPRRDRLGLAS